MTKVKINQLIKLLIKYKLIQAVPTRKKKIYIYINL